MPSAQTGEETSGRVGEETVAQHDSLGALKFRPDIEGLRAVAILFVVFSHYGVPGFSSGFVGVDVFFVISGFLITSLLAREYAVRASETGRRGRISILAFYRRRVFRILPAAMTTIATVLIAGKLFLNQIAFIKIQSDALWATFFATNIQLIRQAADYFQAGLPDSPLQNFWSLAVEEQYYIVWPACFLLVATLLGRSKRIGWLRAVRGAVIVIGLLSFIWCVRSTHVDPASAYFSTLTRAWQLALGAAVALTPGLIRYITGRRATTCGAIGALMLVAALALCGNGTGYPGWLGLLPTVGAALVICAGLNPDARNPIGAVLARREPRAIGRISFSLYLWHWPIVVFAALLYGTASSTWQARIWLLALSFAAAAASYRFIERPFVRYSHRKSLSPQIGAVETDRRQVSRSQVVAMTCVAVFSLGGIAAFARPLPTVSDAIPPAGAELTKVKWLHELNVAATRKRVSVSEQRIAQALVEQQLNGQGETAAAIAGLGARTSGNCASVMTVTSLDQAHACSGKGVGVVDMKWRAGVKPLVILTGNSFAGQWYGELRRILPSNVTVMPLTITSCRPWSFGGSQLDSHGNSCSAHAKFVLDTIRRERPGLTVVSYQRTELDKSQIPGTRKLLRGFRKAGGRVLFLGPAPVLKDFSVCLSTGRSATNCNRYLKPSDWKVEARTANAVHSAGATYLSVQRLVCTKTVCPAFIAGKPARRDGTHLSRWVPRGIAGFVVDAIRRSIRPHRQF